jgi:hypothetical protein
MSMSMSMLNAHVYICCMSMSMLHSHVHTASPGQYCISLSMLHVMSNVHEHAAFPCLCPCPSYMSCPCCMFCHAACLCPFWMSFSCYISISTLHVHVSAVCLWAFFMFISMPHVAYPCYFFMIHVHDGHDASPCCTMMNSLHEHVARRWTWTWTQKLR